jgi:hypothetical protein
MSESKNLWLDAETFSKHKITLAPKFTYLLGDALAKREKKPLLLKVRKADHPHFVLWRRRFYQSKAHLCIFISCIDSDIEFFQLLQNSQLSILSLGLGKFIIELSQIVRRLLKRVACCQKNTISKGEGELFSSLLPADRPKVSIGIKKNEILSNYKLSCKSKGITSQVSASTNKGENQPLQSYPSNFNLIKKCTKKPSLNHQY